MIWTLESMRLLRILGFVGVNDILILIEDIEAI